MVAGENGILSIVVLKWWPPKPNFLCVAQLQFFKMFLQVVADGIGVLGSDLKKSLPVVADEKGIFRSASRKNFKKIILPKLDRIFKSNFPTTCREYKTHFRPTWLEVYFLFPTSCREVDFRNSVQLGQNYFFAFFH